MPATKRTLDYQNKLVLAPMVRIGTLPTRLVALDYGADLVYTEEIIDLRMLKSKRVENAMLGTVDFVMDDDSVTFRTCPKEKDYVVFQIGTSDAQRALKVAKMVENDVAAIDLNMGCPKEYSTLGGMGAALLSTPEIVKDILTTLVNNLSIPVTCKMRILPTVEETLEFVKMVETTGVAAVAVHGRYREERPRHPNHNDIIRLIAETIKIPVIANGGSKHQIQKYEDIEKFRNDCGAAAVMLARSAQWDPSIFRAAGPVPIHDTCKLYLKYALEYDSVPTNIKYNVQQLLHTEMETPRGKALCAAQTMYELSLIWELDKFYEEKFRMWNKYKKHELANCKPTLKKLDDGSEIWEMDFRYNRRNYSANVTPKYVLDKWSRETGRDRAIFDTEENKTQQLFMTVVTVDGVKYASTLWDKSKKCAEQAAAAVFLMKHDMPDGRKEWPGQKGTSEDNSETDKREVEQTSKEMSPTSANEHISRTTELPTTLTTEPTLADARRAPPVSSSTETHRVSPVERPDGMDSSNVSPLAGQHKLLNMDTGPMSESSRPTPSSSGTQDLTMASPTVSHSENPTVVAKEGRATESAATLVSEADKRREALKRRASMTQLIDDIIEKQIRLSEDEPDNLPPRPDCSLIDRFVANEMKKADSEALSTSPVDLSQKK